MPPLISSTVKAELLARGIVCSQQSHDGRKELFRDGRSLGFFTAHAACERFIFPSHRR